MICSKSLLTTVVGISLAAASPVRAGAPSYPAVVKASRSPCYELEVQLRRRQVLDYEVARLTMRQEFVSETVVLPPVYSVSLDGTLVRRSDKGPREGILAPDWQSYPAGTKRFVEIEIRLETPGAHTITVELTYSGLPLTASLYHPECSVIVTFPVAVPAPDLRPEDSELLREWRRSLNVSDASEMEAPVEVRFSEDERLSFRRWYHSQMRRLQADWSATHSGNADAESLFQIVGQRPPEVRSSFFGCWFENSVVASVLSLRKVFPENRDKRLLTDSQLERLRSAWVVRTALATGDPGLACLAEIGRLGDVLGFRVADAAVRAIRKDVLERCSDFPVYTEFANAMAMVASGSLRQMPVHGWLLAPEARFQGPLGEWSSLGEMQRKTMEKDAPQEPPPGAGDGT